MGSRSSRQTWLTRPVDPPSAQLGGRLLWIVILAAVLALLLASADAAPRIDPDGIREATANARFRDTLVTPDTD